MYIYFIIPKIIRILYIKSLFRLNKTLSHYCKCLINWETKSLLAKILSPDFLSS